MSPMSKRRKLTHGGSFGSAAHRRTKSTSSTHPRHKSHQDASVGRITVTEMSDEDSPAPMKEHFPQRQQILGDEDEDEDSDVSSASQRKEEGQEISDECDEPDSASELGADFQGDSEGDSKLLRQQRQTLRTTSFGALAAAQDQLPPRSQPEPATAYEGMGIDPDTTTPQKLQALRERLAELNARRNPSIPSTNASATSKPSLSRKHESRASKHAPRALSSKHQVTRRRAAVSTAGHIFDATAVNAHGMGDPRFSAAAVGASADRDKLARNYGFLKEYADIELLEMKKVLGAAKRASRIEKNRTKEGKLRGLVMSEEEIERLKVEIGRRENRMREEKRREKEAEVKRAHKREERGKIKEGKQPYYLKRGEVRGKVEKETWEGMKAGDRAKAEKKRLARREGKEKKLIPGERRSRAVD